MISTPTAGYMLDTNILWMVGLVRQARTVGVPMSISRVVYAEYLSQMRRHKEVRAAHQYVEGFRVACGIDVVEIEDLGARAFAEIAAENTQREWDSAAERKKRFDRLIAATARSRGRTLVTQNLYDFDHCAVEVISHEEFGRRVGHTP